MFLAVSRVFRGIMGCSRGVPGLFRAVPGCSGDVPGCSGGVPGCSGVFRVLQTPRFKPVETQPRCNTTSNPKSRNSSGLASFEQVMVDRFNPASLDIYTRIKVRSALYLRG